MIQRETMVIDDFISGLIDAKEFIAWVCESPEHAALVDELVIPEARESSYKLYTGYTDEQGRQHRFSYQAIQGCGFSLMRLLRRDHAFNGDLGSNLNLYADVYRFYLLSHPDARYFDDYDRKFDLFIYAISENYGGPEVYPIIEDVVNEAFEIRGKTKQKAFIKSRLKDIFHIEGNKRPYWIQEAEWPMGKNSPMQYVSRKKKGEEHFYLFRDVDTGEERTVTQLW